MTFLAPWILIAFGVLPVLLFLRWHLPQRRAVVVSSVILWKGVRKDALHGAGKGLRKPDAIFLLQLVTLALLILAAARPALLTAQRNVSSFTVIVDRSASNAALLADGSRRWDISRERATDLIKSLAPEDRVMLVAVPGEGTPFSTYGPRQYEALRALDVMDVIHRPADLSKTLGDIVFASDAGVGSNTFVFTDGDCEKLPDYSKLHCYSCGAPSQNLAITDLAISRRDGEVFEVFVACRNFSERGREVELNLFADSVLVNSAVIPIPAGGETRHVFRSDLDGVSSVRVNLAVDDGFPADNDVWAVRRSTKKLSVALVGKPDKFIDQALSSCNGVRVSYLSEMPDKSLNEFGLIVYNRVVPKSLPAGAHVVLVSPPEDVAELHVGNEIQSPQLVPGDSGDTYGLAADLSEIRVATATPLRIDARGDVIAAIDGKPAIVRWVNEGRTITAVGFSVSLDNTAWPLQVSFPIFWAEIADIASNNRATGTEFFFYRSGESIRLDHSSGLTVVETPNGSREHLGADGLFVPSAVGIHRYGANGELREFAVNLLSESESDLSAPERSADISQELVPRVLVPRALDVAEKSNSRVSAEITGWFLPPIVLLFLGQLWLRKRR